MCMFMMKNKNKKVKRTPEQKAKEMMALTKKFLESESGRSMARFMQYTYR